MRIVKIFIILILLYLSFLNVYGLLDPDEPRYATTSKNMIESGEYILPIFNNHPRINKPPLTYWLVAYSYKIFGINEFSARVPHAVLSILLVLFVFFLGKSYMSKELAFLSSIIILSSPFYFFFARLCNTDMILTFFFSISLLSFYKFYLSNDKKFLFLFFTSYLLANLTKGPVAYLIPLILIIFMITEKNINFFRSLKFVFILLLFSVIPLLWLLFVGIKIGNIFSLKSLIFNETIGRMFKGYAHKEPFYFYLEYFPLLYFPWSFIFILKIYKLKDFWKERFLKFQIIWFFVIFLFFSISESKLISYILPLSVPFGIIVSRMLDEVNINFNLKKGVYFIFFILVCIEIFLVIEKEFYFSKIFILFFIYFLVGYFILLKEKDNFVKIGVLIVFLLTGILLFSGKYITDLKSDKFLVNIKFPKKYVLVVFRKRFTGCAFYSKGYIKLDSVYQLKKLKYKNIFVITSKRMIRDFFKNIKYKKVKETKGRILIKIIHDNNIKKIFT